MARRDDEDAEREESAGKVRMDKWLWAARFFKTRRLATEACDAGHVEIGDVPIKPGRVVRVGEQIHIVKESLVYEVVVLALSLRRGPASEATKLYSESDEARRAREVESAARRAAAQASPGAKGRPTKRDRRMLIHHFAKGRTSD